MAVSHKTNILIHCNRCHLPFNFKSTVPKMLSCKHWYCFNCLEQLFRTAKDNEHFTECKQCQRSIDLQGLQNVQQQFIQNYEKSKQQLTQNTAPYHLNKNSNDFNKSDMNKTSFGCENGFAQKDLELENGNTARSTSLASENSMASFAYFSSEGNTKHAQDLGSCRVGNTNATNGVAEKMLPGENCFIHGMPNTLWCQTCLTVLCRGCNAGTDHKEHKVENQLEAKEFYRNRVKQEFLEIQVSVEEIQHLKLLQKGFLLRLLETCCTLKTQIEQELLNNSNNTDIDEIKDTMKNLQLCFGFLDKQTPHEIQELYRMIKDENCKFKLKHKQMLQTFKLQQLLSKSQRILDFEMLKEISHKVEASSLKRNSDSIFKEDENGGNCGTNSIMILTNYCIYRLYMSYMRQQQQFIEQQIMRYQQYHQEQKQHLIKQYKILQQHATATATIQNQQPQQLHQQDFITATTKNEFITTFLDQNNKEKQKTYAEIATIQNAHQFELNDGGSNGFELLPPSSNFQPYKKPLTKSYEEPRKTVQLLFNPINNETNQIYYFDFERNGQHLGRVLIKVFADIAPKMSYNFHALATHEKGFGYSGCKVFECHPNESIITGDIEQNTGYSSRSIYEDVQFIPDDTNITPFAGAVGMRRAKKKFDSQGLVGSQFRIILTELGFTAIFGCVIEGLEVVKKISQTLVQNDKIHTANGSNGSLNNGVGGTNAVGNGGLAVSGIFIAQCGLYEFAKRDIMCGI